MKYLWIKPIYLCARLHQCAVGDFLIRKCVEGMGADNECTYDFYEVTNLYPDVMEEGVDGRFYNDNDFLRV